MAIATIIATVEPAISIVLSAAAAVGCSVPAFVAAAAVTPKAVVPDEVQ